MGLGGSFGVLFLVVWGRVKFTRSTMDVNVAPNLLPLPSPQGSSPTGSLLAPKVEDGESTDHPKRKRASRKGQPKRFRCTFEGCERTYSRAEHLARHQLNHEPKQVYRCDAEDCGHTFVRPDLFARHKARHEEPGEQQMKVEAPGDQSSGGNLDNKLHRGAYVGPELDDPSTVKKRKLAPPESMISEPAPMDPNWPPMPQAQPLLTPSLGAIQSRPIAVDRQLPPLSSLAPTNSQWLGQTSIPAFHNDLSTDHSTDNFAAWLFDSPGSHNSGFDFNNMPFLDFGMDYSMNDMWGIDESGMQGLLGTRTYSNSVTSEPRPVEVEEDPHIRVAEERCDLPEPV